jgi:imidazolonepropionase-like amidohydrolase
MKASALSPVQRVRVLIVLSCLALSFSPSMCAQLKRAAGKQRLALVGGVVYPAPLERPITNSVVLIEDGKIIAVGEKGKLQIPADVQTIDCTGRTIVAGFWNSHVHFTEPKWENAANLPSTQLTKQLQEMLTRYGFTSVVDTGSLLPNTLVIRARIESSDVTNKVAGPRILTAGSPAIPQRRHSVLPGGHAPTRYFETA